MESFEMTKTGNTDKDSKKNPWLWIILAIPTFIVIAGLCTVLITLLDQKKQSDQNVTSISASAEFVNSIQHAKNFNYIADFKIDNSVMEVVISADKALGSENLLLDLKHTEDKTRNVQVRLFNSGKNLFRGHLPPDFEFSKWQLSIYPDSEYPAWRIDNEIMFPNSNVRVKANP